MTTLQVCVYNAFVKRKTNLILTYSETDRIDGEELYLAIREMAVFLNECGVTASVDREKAPNSYLVLSWNDTGKYGTQPKDKDAPIEFRIPYGVYNVLNNNSIPVELSIVSEDEPSASAKTLSASDSDEEKETKDSTVIIRPSMSREVILDVGQYLTISEDAKELIFFYVSEVPEELPSDTTGHAGASQAVVYAYVNGTEVRFRSAPSLDGHIIDTMKNGQQVQVLGITGEWTHVSVQDHKGYIFSQFLSSEDPTPPG